MSTLLVRYVRHHENSREAFERAAAEATTPAERESCQRFAARALHEAEVCAGAWRLSASHSGHQMVARQSARGCRSGTLRRDRAGLDQVRI